MVLAQQSLVISLILTLFSVNGFGSSQVTPKRNVKEEKQQRQHDFWQKERSSAEVEAHVSSCLAGIEDYDLDARVHVISAEPPLVLVHDFLTRTMCEDIMDVAKSSDNMKRSTTGNSQESSNSRTSTTVWLQDEECKGPLRLIAEKVSSISGLPPSYMENLQVVRYQPGQEFNLHTDHQDNFNNLDCRGRLATCLLYLSRPDEGGETWFPEVFEGGAETDVFIAPKQGSAIFFWNTKEKPGSDGYEPEMFLNADPRMLHAGLPVRGGEKWVCNRWIHPVDFGAGVRGL